MPQSPDPRRRPSPGEIRAITGRLQEVVQRGNPDVGWEGDPYLVVEHNVQTDRLQVWDTVYDPAQLVLSKPYDGVGALDTRSLCTRLKEAQFKGQGAQTVVNRVEARNAAMYAEAHKKTIEVAREGAELMLWINKKLARTHL